MNKQLAKIILFGAVLAVMMGYSDGSFAQININIGIGTPLPPLVISEPPSVVLIPSTYVYFVPGISVDILFFHGYWYRPHHGQYYRATSYNGPWVSIGLNSVPGAVVNVPSNFRQVPPGHQRIPYGQLKNNWEIWEKEKQWDKQANVQQSKAGSGWEKGDNKQTDMQQTKGVSSGGKGDNKQAKGGGKGKNKD